MTTIRPELADDRDAIRRVVTAAFGSAAVADLVEAIRASPEYVPAMALVAEVDDAVVGHVMISGATLRADGGERRIVILSPLAVDPAHQGVGIGGALVRAATAIAEDEGEPLVVVEGDPGYYRRFGFEPAAPRGIVMPLPDWAPPEAGSVRREADCDKSLRGWPAESKGAERPLRWTSGQVLRLSGWDPSLHGDVVYPPAFAHVG